MDHKSAFSKTSFDAALEQDRVAEVWEELWRREDICQKWSLPSPEVSKMLSHCPVATSIALDVGCGAGRHIGILSEHSCCVVGIDTSESAIRTCRSRLVGKAGSVSFVRGTMLQLPFQDRCFGIVLAFNVVYHTTHVLAKRAIDELVRCCKPGGYVLFTLLSTRNRAFGIGSEVERNTFLRRGLPGDNGLIHHFFGAEEVLPLTSHHEVVYLAEAEPLVNGQPDHDGYHWFGAMRIRDGRA